MNEQYDAIVVGARCAGSPLAMLLARAGHRVLLVDRATFPSDTISTHFIHPPGVAALDRWGLLERLRASGCPPVERYSFDFGPFTIAGTPRGSAGPLRGYAPRRTVLDALLVEAAAEAGADVREGFSVDEVLTDGDAVTGIRGHARAGGELTATARVVVGADGRHSAVAKAVRPAAYNELPPFQVGYYSYWSGLPVSGFETYIRERRGFAAIPTNDGLTLVIAGWPYAELKANRTDIEGNYMRTLALAPEFAERVAAARREARFVGTAVESYFRKPYGRGWALAGDAGYDRDPITAWGISDAFRDAELCSAAIHDWLAGERPFEDGMAAYQRTRDERSRPLFELTCAFATMEPPPPEMQALLAEAHGDEQAMDAFVGAMAGTRPLEDFFGARPSAPV